MTRSPDVTVVIPVYNALHTVRPCMASVLAWTDLSTTDVVFVNDGSDDHVSHTLRSWSEEHESVTVLENPRNLGFVTTANRGMQAAKTPYIVLLNSDTCVTPHWLEEMVGCMESDPSIGVCSPLTNFAPRMRIDMAPGFTYVEMAELVRGLSERSYPDITTPEGFCFMVSRTCLDTIGYFDEAFRRGYGEESDLSMRARYFGFRTVLADATYIYHRGRGTFGQEQRDALYESNRHIFNDRWKARYPHDLDEFLERDPVGVIARRVEEAVPTARPAFKR